MRRILAALVALPLLVLLLWPGHGAWAAAPAFTLPALPYAANALEPAIDATTMTIHHDRHHQAYVDNLNAAVARDPALRGLDLEELLARASGAPEAVRNNAGGHWNHSFFWASLTRPGQGGEPSSALQEALVRDFGSIEQFRAAFRAAGLARFGSGWVWLITDSEGKLQVVSTPNQDNPLMDLAPVGGTPLLANDVWEHAYYLKYQNRRADYLDAWWSVVDWSVVSDRYATR
ncbi:superoxide dismutase [Synechococcus sp. CBW1107]|uniref:superoxide dismutase n=1 Tax=Synechococcus sp. CBW1107 TaxID=2789857 RepID=UPI002AD49012|nr:superoxide dismutase [Synechococcus sp. CBW1107]CAK6701727.1 Superoxide dismutase [Mn] 2 [Synechococcus sp. CBW1107]